MHNKSSGDLKTQGNSGSKEENVSILPADEVLIYDQYPNPPEGFKKIKLPILRDRNRFLLSSKINMQNDHVNKSFRRYLN